MRTFVIIACLFLMALTGCIAPSEHNRIVAEVRQHEKGAAEAQLAQLHREHFADLQRVRQEIEAKSQATEQALQAVQKDRDDWRARFDEQTQQMSQAIADAVERGIAIGMKRRGVEALLSVAQDSALLLLGMLIGGGLLLYSWLAANRLRYRTHGASTHLRNPSCSPVTGYTYHKERNSWSPILNVTT